MRYQLLGALIGSIIWASGCGKTQTVNANSPNPKPVTSTAANQPKTSSTPAASDKPSPLGRKRYAAAKPPAAPDSVALPAGTVLRVRTTSTISTKTADVGDRFVGTLEVPLIVGGTVVASKRADVMLAVVNADAGGRVKGRATLTVRPVQIRGAHGGMIPVTATTETRVAEGSKKKDAAKVGVVGGIGAAIGAIAAGGKGAALGALSGAGAGTGYVLATRGKPAVIPAETLLTFRTTAPLTVRAGTR
ncbi:MAG: hypothetical protein IT168_13810 [Bryobacterales bacterium]|nr:hypothetical protein [Bryobacterales bacterium]